MCGCMLMHAGMDHSGHQAGDHSSTHVAPGVVPAVAGAKCPHCAFPLGAGFAFCPNCGIRLGATKCAACGQTVEPNWRACAYCGSPLAEAQVEAQ